MKIRTAELTGVALDWAVAKCEGYASGCGGVVPYSTDWSQGGPIVEREGTSLTQFSDYPMWTAKNPNSIEVNGGTPLVAAMRAYVYLRLGHEIEVPEELL